MEPKDVARRYSLTFSLQSALPCRFNRQSGRVPDKVIIFRVGVYSSPRPPPAVGALTRGARPPRVFLRKSPALTP
ncbi:hypothetical protein EVAR_58099_1 [Eumeta japonica]|uniref:Uncharacterized protein n=1 Tax=Eumeta variegata TaxID=151549 RepID=A0A4C1YNJ9_EUMVA|nr:hypothetical protein EVAR_58099_1 [Eumeta japonica]